MRGWRRRALAVAAVAVAAIGVIALAIGITGWAALGAALAPGGLMPVFASIGGASTTGPSTSGASTATIPPLADSPSTSAPPQRYSDGSISERGNIPKRIGEKAGILAPDGQSHLVTFTVTRIVTDPRCLNIGAPAPAHGHYVEVDLDVITSADLGADGSDQTVSFARDNWFFYPPDSDGIIAGGSSAIADADDCQLAVPALPDAIGASQTVSGSVLLDVAPGAVYLSFNPGLVCGCQAAWEWPYSDK